MSQNPGLHEYPHRESPEFRTKHGRLKGILGLVLLVTVLPVVTGLLLFSPVRGAGAPEVFVVRAGEGAAGLGYRLQSEGIIRSGFGFHLFVTVTGSAARLKAGTYLAEPGSWTFGIVSRILQGREYAIRVTVPEGLTVKQTALLLERSGILSAADFSAAVHDQNLCESLGIPGKSAEGFLFPDTYFFPPKSAGKEIIRRMAANFFKNLDEVLSSSPGQNAKAVLFERVILASIIEREYRRTEEAPLISSVFMNRLQSGMRLQSCATVVYVLTEKRNLPHPEIVTLKDLEIRDEYNTYRNAGLPPAPICSPGKVALKAAFFPARTDFLYFRLVDEESGKHAFSKTLDEHRLNAVPSVKKSGM